jgi:hypothetical protein
MILPAATVISCRRQLWLFSCSGVNICQTVIKCKQYYNPLFIKSIEYCTLFIMSLYKCQSINRKSIETRGYLICTKRRKKKNTFPVVTICNTNEQASKYDLFSAFPFITINKPRTKWANQWACSGVQVTIDCTQVNALCML